MIEIVCYLLKVSICLTLFLGSYALLLKRLSFFKANRIYLLATLFLSFIIPSLSFERNPDSAPAHFFNNYVPVEQLTSRSLAPISINDELNLLSVSGFLCYCYVLVTIALLCRGFFKVYQLIQHADADFIRVDDLKVIDKKTGFVNCSFFNYVFIDSANLTDKELEILLKHEQVHARQLHTLDKLILLIFKALLWFNPVIYWYEMALEEVHEFEADAITANAFSADVYAHLLIELATKKEANQALHNFSRHPLKIRIITLYQTTSNTRLQWSYLIIIPLLICLGWLFAFKVPDLSLARGSNFVLVLDAGHGGQDTGAQGGGFLEKDLALLILQKVSDLAKESNLKVLTTRNVDQDISLKERIKAKGDLLISIHINQHSNTKVNGIQLLLGNAGIDKVKSRKLGLVSYQLYKNLSSLKGITTNNTPEEVSGLYILDKSPAPAVILELGYLSNKNDRDYLTDPVKQQELANAIVNSILAYHKDLNKLSFK